MDNTIIKSSLIGGLFCCTVLFLLSACSGSDNSIERIEVSAASSLTDVLNEISLLYSEDTGRNTELSFASSSVCARQIKEGKSSSIFISASDSWMDYLEDLYIEDSDRTLLHNSLVFIVPGSSDFTAESLVQLKERIPGNIAMGDPSHVPAGIYGRMILKEQGFWEEMQSSIVGAMDVRAALALVETEAVEGGIVYRTDALSTDKVKTLFEMPQGKNKIRYRVSRFDNKDNTVDFYNYLFSPGAREIFLKYGFISGETL